jgi:uncharacterized protein (DUF1800 family)
MATWNLDNAAHLLRRAAFGGSPDEIENFHDHHSSVDDAVDDLMSFAPSKKKPPGASFVDDEQRLKMQRWWLKQILKAKSPRDAAREKLVVFFHNFLVSGADKQPELKFMSYQNRLFRLFGKGSFKTLIRELTRDPANLFYLDGITNDASRGQGVGPGGSDIVVANENFGRELMELFTLGPSQFAADGTNDPSKPNYTEADVHNMARAATGWVDIVKDKGVFRDYAYDGGQYDDDGDGNPDPITIFGQSSNDFRLFSPEDAGAGGPDDALELIFAVTDDASNNQSAMFVSRKLWEWYAYPPPAPGLKTLLEGFAASFVAADYDIATLLGEILRSDEFYSDTAKSRTVKSPLDYVVQAMKTLHVRGNGRYVGDANVELGTQVAQMGMDLFQPPNVAGWPGSLAWITSGTLIERLGFARDLGASDFGSSRIRISKLEKITLGSSSVPVDTVVDQVIAQLGMDIGPLALTSVQRDVLIAFASDDGALSTLDLSSEGSDDVQNKLRGLITLALQSAEAQVF